MEFIMDNVFMNKVGLKELITYHEAEFEIIGGYHYNEGRNNTINHAIEDFYNLINNVKNLKKEPAQIVIKLLMNSVYGKTFIKPVETYTTVKDNMIDFGKYTSYN